MPGPAELFVSYSRLDQDFADALRQVLERHGVPFWYSPRHLLGAPQWHDQIGTALDRCDWFALILSPSAVRSRWVRRELLYVLEDGRYQDRIIPIFHLPCAYKKLSWTLSSFQFVDFVEQSFEAGCEDLLRIWSLGFQPSLP